MFAIFTQFGAGDVSITTFITNCCLIASLLVTTVNNAYVGYTTHHVLSCFRVSRVSPIKMSKTQIESVAYNSFAELYHPKAKVPQLAHTIAGKWFQTKEDSVHNPMHDMKKPDSPRQVLLLASDPCV